MTRVFNRMALTLLAGSLLTACASTTSPSGERGPRYPIRAPAAPASETPTEPAPPAARPTETVAARPLAPPPGAAVAPPRSEPEPYRPAPAMPPPSPPRPQVETVVRTSVTGKVVDAAGPARTHKVEKGDTVYSIARKFDVSPDKLAKDNNLGKSSTIRPGQVLKGPSSKAKAYQVVSGDTLYAIARRFSVTPQALAEANDMKIDGGLRVGQKVVLPDGYKDKGPTTTTVRVPVAAPPAPAYTPPPAPVPTYTPPTPRPPPAPVYTPAPAPTPPQPRPTLPPAITTPPARPIETPRPAPTPPPPVPVPTPPLVTAPRPTTAAPVIIPTTPPASDAALSQLGRGRFVWPIRGAMVSDFGPKGTGQRNDGINIRAVAGEAVRAAAGGDVVYAGDQVPGFGNLVLIKHADGWVTAYGHLSRLDVKMQDKVGQNQQIGQAGASGGVAEPQLHFEVRYAPTPADRARPINPMLVLPK